MHTGTEFFNSSLPSYACVKIDVMAVGRFSSKNDKLNYLQRLQKLKRQTISATAQNPHFSRGVFSKNKREHANHDGESTKRVLIINFTATTLDQAVAKYQGNGRTAS